LSNKDSVIPLTPENIVSRIRRLLNESALKELENVRILLGERKPPRKKRGKTEEVREQPSTQGRTEEEGVGQGDQEEES